MCTCFFTLTCNAKVIAERRVARLISGKSNLIKFDPFWRDLIQKNPI